MVSMISVTSIVANEDTTYLIWFFFVWNKELIVLKLTFKNKI